MAFKSVDKRKKPDVAVEKMIRIAFQKFERTTDVDQAEKLKSDFKGRTIKYLNR